MHRAGMRLTVVVLALVSLCGCAVDATGPDPSTGDRFDLEIVGHGFDAYEGHQVHVVISARAIAADWLVEYGAFRMRFADAIAPGSNDSAAFYVDLDDSGGCDAYDVGWTEEMPLGYGDYVMELDGAYIEASPTSCQAFGDATEVAPTARAGY